MSNNETILIELGFFTRDSKFEEFKTNFGYGWSSEDLKEAIDVAGENTSNVRNFLMEILWLKVVYEYVDNKGCDREQFDCYVNGSLDTHFTLKERRLIQKKTYKNFLMTRITIKIIKKGKGGTNHSSIIQITI